MTKEGTSHSRSAGGILDGGEHPPTSQGWIERKKETGLTCVLYSLLFEVG